MPVFSHPEFDGHQTVLFHHDAASGLRALVAVHSTALGPGLGGCRVYPYANDALALTDVLRLSRGMTYKAALAGLKQGGGKAVVIADPRREKTPAMMRAMGRLVQSMGGSYVIAEDSGTDDADMVEMAKETRYIGGGAEPTISTDPEDRDTSSATALGVFYGIQAAVRFKLGRSDLLGLRVAIQGAGKVGRVLAGHLHGAGARLFVCDAYAPAVEDCVRRFDATPAEPGQLFALDVDVFSPCALGAILNDDTIPTLVAPIIAGAANNQLEAPRHGRMLLERGKLYAPDYAINAGGIINLYYEGPTRRWADVNAHLRRIGDTLSDIFQRSATEHRPTHEIADEIAESRFRPTPPRA